MKTTRINYDKISMYIYFFNLTTEPKLQPTKTKLNKVTCTSWEKTWDLSSLTIVNRKKKNRPNLKMTSIFFENKRIQSHENQYLSTEMIKRLHFYLHKRSLRRLNIQNVKQLQSKVIKTISFQQDCNEIYLLSPSKIFLHLITETKSKDHKITTDTGDTQNIKNHFTQTNC